MLSRSVKNLRSQLTELHLYLQNLQLLAITSEEFTNLFTQALDSRIKNRSRMVYTLAEVEVKLVDPKAQGILLLTALLPSDHAHPSHGVVHLTKELLTFILLVDLSKALDST